MVTGATGAVLSNIGPDKLGSYMVTVTNTSGLPCSASSGTLVIGDSATRKLFILPNPSSGEFDVVYYSSGNTNYTLRITDAKAATVYRNTYPISSAYQPMHVDMRSNSSGLYQVAVYDPSGRQLATGKILLQQ